MPKSIWTQTPTLDDLNQRAKGSLSDHLGICFTAVGEDYLQASMPVNAHTRQPLGILHGGASCVLAESIGSTAAQYCIDFNTHYCVGLDINTNHIRSIQSGTVVATTRPFHLGRSTQVWSIEIHDESQKLISVTRLTMAILKRN